MRKQFWVICNEKEQQKLLSKLFGYEIDIDTKKFDFPLVIDTETKTIFRCTSVSCCAAQTVKYGKIKNYTQMKSILQNELIDSNKN